MVAVYDNDQDRGWSRMHHLDSERNEKRSLQEYGRHMFLFVADALKESRLLLPGFSPLLPP